MIRIITLITLIFISSCKFQPLNSAIEDQTYNEILSEIKIGKIDSKKSFFLMKDLERQLNPQGLEKEKKYLLNLKVTSSIQDLFVKKDGDISRQQIKSFTEYNITSLLDGNKLIDSGNFNISLSYPTSESIYSTYANEEYTLKNSFKEIARNIKLRAIIALTKDKPNENTSKRK